MSQIVLISGKQGSGKTTLQKALMKRWYAKNGYDAEIVNFADILYEMHDSVLSILHRYYPNRGLVKDGPLLQLLGTEWGRKTLGADVWVNCLKEKVRQYEERMELIRDKSLIIVGDCRFENEFDAFPRALRVRLNCSEAIRKQRCSMWRENTQHPSETGLDKYADEKRFDLNLDSGDLTADHCLDIVQHALNQKLIRSD